MSGWAVLPSDVLVVAVSRGTARAVARGLALLDLQTRSNGVPPSPDLAAFARRLHEFGISDALPFVDAAAEMPPSSSVMTTTVHNAAARLGLTDRRVRQLLDATVLRGCKVGGKWSVDAASVDEIEQRRSA